MIEGEVTFWDTYKRYGFITANDKKVFVHLNELQNGLKSLSVGQLVTFELSYNAKGAIARKVLPKLSQGKSVENTYSNLLHISSNSIGDKTQLPSRETEDSTICSELESPKMESEEIEILDTEGVEQGILNEISKWKLEAKAEDSDRYFWHVREVDQIKQGEKYFVIGRKGTGKTAVCEYFSRLQNHNVFAEKLSFKNFPFNELYSMNNNKYTPPNQYISIWKYLIYSTICRLMLKNEEIDPAVRNQLNKIYGDDISLKRRLERWVGKEFSLSLFGLSFKFSKQRQNNDQINWIESIDYLEDIIQCYADETTTYYVLFDELDEDYREIVEKEQNKQYSSLITSLFKAVQDIRTTINKSLKIYPIVFLRDDIYELVKDSDKNKWGDFRVDLNWDVHKIKRLIAFRISRSIDPGCETILNFDDAWSRLFGKQGIFVGNRKKNRITTFDYIVRSTLLRPRDFVNYLQNCALCAIEDKTKILPSIVKRVDKAFSNYLKDELTDELFAILPDISFIFDAISQLRKWNFSIKEIENAYTEQVNRGIIKEQNVKYVLQILFLFSVIGNTPRPEVHFFRYKNREARLNFNERVVIHRGLFKALQII